MTMRGRRYTTISIPVEVKRALEESKGDREWGDFLLNLLEEYKRYKRERAFDNLRKILSEKDLEEIERSSREFRERFALR